MVFIVLHCMLIKLLIKDGVQDVIINVMLKALRIINPRLLFVPLIFLSSSKRRMKKIRHVPESFRGKHEGCVERGDTFQNSQNRNERIRLRTADQTHLIVMAQ